MAMESYVYGIVIFIEGIMKRRHMAKAVCAWCDGEIKRLGVTEAEEISIEWEPGLRIRN